MFSLNKLNLKDLSYRLMMAATTTTTTNPTLGSGENSVYTDPILKRQKGYLISDRLSAKENKNG